MVSQNQFLHTDESSTTQRHKDVTLHQESVNFTSSYTNPKAGLKTTPNRAPAARNNNTATRPSHPSERGQFRARLAIIFMLMLFLCPHSQPRSPPLVRASVLLVSVVGVLATCTAPTCDLQTQREKSNLCTHNRGALTVRSADVQHPYHSQADLSRAGKGCDHKHWRTMAIRCVCASKQAPHAG